MPIYNNKEVVEQSIVVFITGMIAVPGMVFLVKWMFDPWIKGSITLMGIFMVVGLWLFFLFGLGLYIGQCSRRYRHGKRKRKTN